MDFPSLIVTVLSEDETAVSVDADMAGFAVAPLSDQVEAVYSSVGTGSVVSTSSISDSLLVKLDSAAALLHTAILASVSVVASSSPSSFSGTTLTRPTSTALTDKEAKARTRDAIAQVQVLRASSSSSSEALNTETELKNIAELLRAGKNLLRWYLQFVLPALGGGGTTTATTTSASSSSTSVSTPLNRLQNHDMMELYLLLVEATVGDADNHTKQQVARQACLSLFYSTYQSPATTGTTTAIAQANAHPSLQSNTTATIQRAQTHLVEDLNFPKRALTLLKTNNTPEVCIALIRILHNLLASVPGLVEQVEDLSISLVVNSVHEQNAENDNGDRMTNKTSAAPWIPTIAFQEQTTTNSLATNLTLQSLLLRILFWFLQAPPAFPGNDNDNATNARRPDLVLEILRVLYILRAAKHIMIVDNDKNNPEHNEQHASMLILQRIIAYFFKLPNSVSERAYRCKLAAISLLMDAPAAYGQTLVQQKNVLPLMDVLDRQVSQVVAMTTGGSSSNNATNSGQRRGSGSYCRNDYDTENAGSTQRHSQAAHQMQTAAVGSAAAAAAVVPILTVVNKFCNHGTDSSFCDRAKSIVYPPDSQAHFERLVRKQQQQHQEQQGDDAKKRSMMNMQPLDCPEYTLRWKLVKLMTWPESHVKRIASELLWSLCNHDQGEFVGRTGFGNALPLLSSKGLFKLPAELSS